MRISSGILLAATLAVIGVVCVLFALRRSADHVFAPVTIETAHLPVLPPHEHEEQDAVSDAGHHEEVLSPRFVAEYDMLITGIRFEIVGAPRSVLHHAALVSRRCVDATCSASTTRDLVRYGQDTMYDTSGRFPAGYALPVHAGESLELRVMIHNPEPPIGPGGTYHEVYGRIILTQADPTAVLTPVRFVMLSLGGTCEKALPRVDEPYTFTIPPRTRAFIFSGCGEGPESGTYRFAEPGTIVHLGAHLHGWQGGKELIVKKDGVELYRFVTVRAPEDSFRFDTYPSEEPIHIEKGDSLSIRAVYDNPAAVPIRGAMGMLGIYIADKAARE